MYDSFYDVVLPQPEIWKDINGCEGCYKVSNYGEVKSLTRFAEWETKEGKYGGRNIPERILKPKSDKDGYFEYCLSVLGIVKYRRGHRLVAENFFPHKNQDNLVVDHKDAIKYNNVAWNLQWMTSEENTIKYYADEFGKEKTLSKVTKEEWKLIGELYNKGMLYKDIVAEMGLTLESPDSLFDVLSGRRLASVSGFKKGDFKKRPHPVQKLSDDQVMQILYERLVSKIPLKIISKKYGIAESMISRFCKGTRRCEMLEKFNKEGGFKWLRKLN